jgi:hypothetical protein
MVIYPSSSRRRQEFCVDRTNLVERFAQRAKIANQIGDLLANVVWHIVSALPATGAGLTDGQISLGSMSRSVDAVAVRPTAPFVRFDQCAAQNVFDRRQVAHDAATSFAKQR